MLTTLQLRPCATPQRPATAWFLPGTDAAAWLEELARCGLAHTATRLWIVPKTMDRPDSAGLLVLPAEGQSPCMPPRGLACGTVGQRLLLPVDAALCPNASEEEIRELCQFSLLFFHPAHGLTGFEEKDALRVQDLLEPPLEQYVSWNLAKPGPPPPARLKAILLAEPPTPEDIFGEESGDIGSESDEPMDPAPDEPKEDAWSKAGREARRKLAKNVGDLLRKLPGKGKGAAPGWLNNLENWANRQLSGISSQLERLRNKELHRLLHLLDKDPEAGLRHAIPMNNFGHRGRAPAGARLGPRNLHFDPRRLGGGPADCWDVPHDLQMELTRRYRELADRELRLRRYRRAAYIYAELLGDLASAAKALVQGRHFREAAILFEERLNNPVAAAQCLADGGLLREAIERFEKLGRLLQVADLYERLGDSANAALALRRLVSQKLAAGDTLGAASLLETRLQAVDEALTLLEQAWPRSRQAFQCLSAQFALLARLGRHEVALARLARLRRDKLPSSQLESFAEVLVDEATKYPDERLRRLAADLARVSVGRRLSEPTLANSESSQLVRLLFRLAPLDRLLTRDGNRYLTARRERELANKPSLSHGPTLEPRVLRAFELPKQIQWLQVRADGPWFFAAGATSQHLTLIRGTWEGELQSLTWPCPATAARSALLFEPVRLPGGRCVLMSIAGQPALREQVFPPDLFISVGCAAGTPHWLSNELFPFTVVHTTLWTVHVAAGRAVLSCTDMEGHLLRTLDVTDALLADAHRTEATRLSLAKLWRGPAIALGNRLIVQQDGNPGRIHTRVELPGQVTALVPTLPHTRPGVVALLDRGACIYWIDGSEVLSLDEDVQWISATWIPSGKLILLSRRECRVLDVDSRGVYSVKTFAWHIMQPVSVTQADEPNHFAVFCANGQAVLFTAPDK